MKNKIPAIIGGTTALLGIGFIIYYILGLNTQLGPFSVDLFANLELLPIVLKELLYATLLTIMFSRWAHITTFSKGVRVGFIIGAFIGVSSSLEVLATGDLMNIGGVLEATASFGLRFALAGGVIAWVLGNEKEDE